MKFLIFFEIFEIFWNFLKLMKKISNSFTIQINQTTLSTLTALTCLTTLTSLTTLYSPGLFFVHFAKNSRPKKLKILAFGQKLNGFFAKNSRLWGPILKMTKKLKNHKTQGYEAQSKQSQKTSNSKQSINLNASLWLGLLDPC